MWLLSSGKSRRAAAVRRRHAPNQLRLEVLENRSLLSASGLDSTFGNAGMVTTHLGIPTSGDQAYAVAVANDGKIVAAGITVVNRPRSGPDYDFGLVRYKPDGSLDATFGGDGKVTTNFGTDADTAFDVEIQPNGKIVAAGKANADFAVARYNLDGSLDASFGGTGKGKVTTDINKNSLDEGRAMELQADGKIVVAGVTAPKSSSGYDIALVRYNADGSLDSTFDMDGKVTTHFSSPISGAYASMEMAIYSGNSVANAGKILVVGQLNKPAGEHSIVIVRYNQDGSLDSSFGSGAGFVTISNVIDTIPSIAIQSDDRIVVAYPSRSPAGDVDTSIARLSPSGNLDGTFGSNGVVVTALPANQIPRSVTIQPDGKIVVAGNQGANFMVARYNQSNGSLDDGGPNDSTPLDGFGLNGVATTTTASLANSEVDIALQSDGKIVVAGSTTTGDWTLARFATTVPRIGSLTASLNSVTFGVTVTITAAGVTAANPGSKVVQVAYYLDSNGDGKLDAGSDTLLGLGTEISSGVWTFNYTVNLKPGTRAIFAQAEDSFGVHSDPLAVALTID